MIYLDTSYIVKCYVREPGTAEILRWLEGTSGLFTCIHGRLELFAALRRHLSEGRLTPAAGRGVFRRIEADERDGLWRWLPVSQILVASACERMQRLPHGVSLRAADALHLACAADNGFDTIYSHDRRLLESAPHFGLKGRDILAADDT